MLKVVILVKEATAEDQQSWEQTFSDVWEGPVEITFQDTYSRSEAADLIVIDFTKWTSGTKEFLASLSSELSGKNFIIFSGEKDLELAVDAIKLGCISFLFKPLKRVDLLSTLGRLTSLIGKKDTSTSDTSQTKSAKIITISSYKGGTGVTTAAVNLAYALSNNFQKKTLIIDACAYANHVSLLLNTIPKCNLIDLCKQGKNLDVDYFNHAVANVNKTLGIIGGLIQKVDSSEANFAILKHINHVASSLYDYIIIDTAARVVDEITMFFIKHADMILLLTTLDILSVKDMQFYMQALVELGIPENKLKPVINRVDLYKGNVETETFQKQINRPIFHTIPNDWETCVNASVEARPLQVIAPNSKIASSYKLLAEKIINMDSNLPVVEIEAKKGLLSWLKR